ncbi:MAG: DinB family protein, partial [Bacteroidota bacterium]
MTNKNNFDVPQRLRQSVAMHYPQLLEIAEAQYQQFPAPGKWSALQIMGHLVDSAANNHQRFVRAQFQDNLVF